VFTGEASYDLSIALSVCVPPDVGFRGERYSTTNDEPWGIGKQLRKWGCGKSSLVGRVYAFPSLKL
jgi:hypothetical protein